VFTQAATGLCLFMKVTNKMQLYRLIYYSKSAPHVSGDVFAHHQEHLTVFTVSGSVHLSCCRLVSLYESNQQDATYLTYSMEQSTSWEANSKLCR
jgi:hypothetical protein